MKMSSVEVELSTIQETVSEVMSVSQPSVPELDTVQITKNIIRTDAQK